MYVFASETVPSTGLAAELAQWSGRLIVLLLIYLLIRKYVFKKDAPRLGRRKPEQAPTAPPATAATAAPSAPAPGSAVLPPSSDILPK